MFNFNHQNKSLDLVIDGCFEPNLTTKIMLSSAIKELENRDDIKTFLELGCGSGVISTYLLKHGFFSNIASVGMSDLSRQAVSTSELNISAHSVEGMPAFEFKVGSGMQIWTDFECELIVNDISAISEAIVPMNDWFKNAPNNSGLDGIANSIQVLEEFSSIASDDTVMLMPVLSLSNVKMLETCISELGLKWETVLKQSWPLPGDMVMNHGIDLKNLRSCGHISMIEKFGQFIVETACYKVRKV